MNEVVRTIDAWRLADADARAAEMELREAWTRYHTGSGPAPDETLFIEVSRRRDVANRELSRAMAVMGSSSRPSERPAGGASAD